MCAYAQLASAVHSGAVECLVCTCVCVYMYASLFLSHLPPQVLAPVVTWEALDNSSRKTVVGVGEGAEEAGVATEEGVEETKQLDSQMGRYMYANS